MKFFCLALILFTLFSLPVSAQLCGKFGVKFDIHSSELKTVKGVKIAIVAPSPKKEGSEYLRPEHQFEPVPQRSGQYQIVIGEGLEVADGYRVVITAPGFVKQERPITFPHCTRLAYDITMLRDGEKAQFVTGKVTDETGDPVPYAELTFYNTDGTERSINADQNGLYEIKLKPGTYRVESELMYFHTTRVKKFDVHQAGASTDTTLDIKMKSIGGSEQFTVIDQ